MRFKFCNAVSEEWLINDFGRVRRAHARVEFSSWKLGAGVIIPMCGIGWRKFIWVMWNDTSIQFRVLWFVIKYQEVMEFDNVG
jgi:hypothetical protein